MEDTSLIRKILFYVLIILTIFFIYTIFFPKRSYIKDKIDDELFSSVEEIFNQNITSMYIAGQNYFSNNDKNIVTLQELIENNLLVDLKDSNNEICNISNSSVQLKDEDYIINLDCPNKKDTIIKTNDETKGKLLCLYQYKKQIENGYTNWGEFSTWQEEEIESDELTNVETKEEQIPNGTKIITNSRNISIDATYNMMILCPNGYKLENNKCKKETYLNTVSASVKYECPNNYKKSGLNCINNNDIIQATKIYYCSNYDNIELKLNGSQCDAYRINYIDSKEKKEYYTCPNNYELSGNKCITTEYYEEEVNDYQTKIYYRYQTREKVQEQVEIKWSKPNDLKLIDDGFIQEKKITCEI